MKVIYYWLVTGTVMVGNWGKRLIIGDFVTFIKSNQKPNFKQ